MSKRNLKCSPAIPAAELPRMPLFPGRRQRWLVTQRIISNSEEEQDAALLAVFQLWTEIIPGDIGAPEVVAASDGPTSSLVQAPALGFRGPSRLVAVEFDYNGTSTEMRWPTHVKRRRERIDPLCPMSPVDTMPIGVAGTDIQAAGDEVLPALTDQTAPDPVAILPPGAGTDAIQAAEDAAKAALPTLQAVALIAGAGALVVLLLRSGRR